MKKRTHFYIARLSVKNNRTINPDNKQKVIKEWAFYLGTILPDLSVFQFIHPHYYDKSAVYVFNKLKKIAYKPTRGVSDAIGLGKMVHYLCDFCCYAHIGGKIGCVSEHVQYERGIQQYIINNYCQSERQLDYCLLGDRTAEGIMKQVKSELADYYNRTPSYQLDIMKSVNISAIIYYGLIYNRATGRNISLDIKAPAAGAEVLP